MAYFPVFLVSRLCLYSFGRKSQRRGMHLSKPAYRIFPYRNVAWGWNGVYPLGALSWLFLILERVWLGKKLEKLPGIVGWGYTVTAVFFGWILFRAENISLFFTYVRNMFVAHGGTILLSAYLDSKMIFLIVMGVLFAGVLQKIYERSGTFRWKNPCQWNGDSSENDRLYGDFLAECGGTCK